MAKFADAMAENQVFTLSTFWKRRKKPCLEISPSEIEFWAGPDMFNVPDQSFIELYSDPRDIGIRRIRQKIRDEE